MSDADPSEDQEDSGDAAVPDYAGELDHESRDGEGDAATRPERIRLPSLLALAAIVLAVGALILWAVLTRGPA